MNLAKEVVRFQLASLSSYEFTQNTSADSTMIDSVVEKVIAKLSDMNSVHEVSNSLNYIRGNGQRGRRCYYPGAIEFIPNYRGNTYQTRRTDRENVGKMQSSDSRRREGGLSSGGGGQPSLN